MTPPILLFTLVYFRAMWWFWSPQRGNMPFARHIRKKEEATPSRGCGGLKLARKWPILQFLRFGGGGDPNICHFHTAFRANQTKS